MITKNIRIAGHRTSVRLERLELTALAEICTEQHISVNEFCERADRDPARMERSRTSRIRMAILAHCRGEAKSQAGELQKVG